METRKFTYKTSGTCSQAINFELDEQDRVVSVEFVGGCPGNTFGVAQLCKGADARQLIERLQGIDCRSRGTSCPDQLARALREALAEK